MPRYFFHPINGDRIADDVGEEFDLIEEARGHALAVARYIAVVDERGVVVFTVLLRFATPLVLLLRSGALEVFC
jgi:hypothetical protein